jgi:hydroxymethylglutaryl-CoA synthase
VGVTGIAAAGAYAPRFRITADEFAEAFGSFDAAGVSEKAVPAADEDSVTMAVAAARDALAGGPVDRDEIAGLAVGSTTPPVDEGDVAARVAEILGLGRGVETSVHTQSTRAGTRAVVDAARMDGPALAVAADAPRGDPDDALGHAAGAGAVALVLADDGPASVEETAHYTREFAGTRFRERGSDAVETYDATAYERDAYTSVVAGAVDRLDSVGEVVAPTAPDGKLPYRATSGIDADAEVVQAADELGDTGAASPLFGLCAAWADGASSVTVVGYGDGASADALTVSGTLAADWDRETEQVTYAEYARKRGYVISEGGDH